MTKQNKAIFILFIIMIVLAFIICVSTIIRIKVKNINTIPKTELNKELSAESGFFWFVSHKDDGSIDLNNFYKGNKIKICVNNYYNGALKSDFYYKNDKGFGVIRKIYKFENKTDSIEDSCIVGKKSVEISIPNESIPLLLSVIPESGNTEITIMGSEDFPFQGKPSYDIPLFLLEAVTAGNSIITK